MSTAVIADLGRKGVRAVRTRPWAVLSLLRRYTLFKLTALRLRSGLASIEGLELGENVRLQSTNSVHPELPNGSVRIGSRSVIYEDARLEAYGNGVISIGEDSMIGQTRVCSRGKVTIGKRFLCSWNVFIQDFDAHPIDPDTRREHVERMIDEFHPGATAAPRHPEGESAWGFNIRDISIGDDVWIGANALILKGAQIGNGVIVAAGSVVTAGSYPDHSIVAGNPAKVVKHLR